MTSDNSIRRAPTLYALLVGIDRYASDDVPDLQGCENDVRAMKKLLLTRFGVKPENVRTLVNEKATRQAILQEFRSYVIDPAKKSKEADQPIEIIYHFCGHGSRQQPSREDRILRQTPDQRVETTVPHDSRTENVFDIRDWELGALLDELNDYTENVTVILDCCHSGSGTREVPLVDEIGNVVTETFAPDRSGLTVRMCPPDQRLQNDVPSPSSWGRTRSADTSEAKHVLIAGCDAHSTSKSMVYAYEIDWQTSGQPGKPLYHGVLTYHLIRHLEGMRQDQPLTYRELHQRVQEDVRGQFPTQSPQCEGDRDREVFGSMRPRSETFFSVTRVDGDYYSVNGGLVHGMTPGSILAVHPAETRQTGEAKPLGLLRVVEPGAIESCCKLDSGLEKSFPPYAKAVLHSAAFTEMTKHVALDIDEPQVQSDLEAQLAMEPNAPFVRIRKSGDGTPYFRVDFKRDNGSTQLLIRDGSGKPLVAPYLATEPEKVARDLVHLARYHNVRELQNLATNSNLNSGIKMRLLKQIFHRDGTPITNDSQVLSKRLFEPITDDEITEVHHGDRLAVEIENTSEEHLYIAVFVLGCDYSVSQLYPWPGEFKHLTAGKSFVYGEREHRDDQSAVCFTLPDPWPESDEYLKLIATTEKTDLSILHQDGLRSPYERPRSIGSQSGLPELLEAAMCGGNRPGRYEEGDGRGNDWTTAELTYRMRSRCEGKGSGGSHDSVDPDFRRDVLTHSHFSLQTALSLATSSLLAYETDTAVINNALARWGFDDSIVFDGETSGYAGIHDEMVLVAFRGTASVSDWIRNLKIHQVEGPFGQVHKGFADALEAVWERYVRPLLRMAAKGNKNVWFTGHSLGGALAVLAGARAIDIYSVTGIYTFGQPQLGNQKFATAFRDQNLGDRCHRFVNDQDIVPRVPPAPLYAHVGKTTTFDRAGRIIENRSFRSADTSDSAPLSVEEFETLQQYFNLNEQDLPDTTERGMIPFPVLKGIRDHSLADGYLPKLRKAVDVHGV